MVLVPATMSLLGHTAWWLPRWLDRRLPHLNLEGDDVAEEELQEILADGEREAELV